MKVMEPSPQSGEASLLISDPDSKAAWRIKVAALANARVKIHRGARSLVEISSTEENADLPKTFRWKYRISLHPDG